MVIDGVSQSTGAERLVEVAADGDGLRLSVRDRIGNSTPVVVVFSPADLMTVLSDQPQGAQTIACTEGQELTVEVRRNEVLLALGAADAAVGLDDLMDAVAGAVPPS